MHPPIRRHGTAGQERVPVVRRNGQHGVAVTFQHLPRLRALQIVQHQVTRFGPRDDIPVARKVGRDGVLRIRVMDRVGIRPRALVGPGPVDGPQPQRRVHERPRQYVLRIGTEPGRADGRIARGVYGLQALARGDIPQSDQAVVTGAAHHRSVATETDTRHGIAVGR